MSRLGDPSPDRVPTVLRRDHSGRLRGAYELGRHECVGQQYCNLFLEFSSVSVSQRHLDLSVFAETMGVTVTPPSRPPNCWRIIACALSLIQSFVFAQDSSAKTEAQRKLSIVWGGQSEIGFLKAELWNVSGPGKHHFQELVIYSPSEMETPTYEGMMIPLPSDVRTEPSISQVFARSSADLEAGGKKDLRVVATLSPDGTLRLYACGRRLFFRPAQLTPQGRSE